MKCASAAGRLRKFPDFLLDQVANLRSNRYLIVHGQPLVISLEAALVGCATVDLSSLSAADVGAMVVDCAGLRLVSRLRSLGWCTLSNKPKCGVGPGRHRSKSCW